ncbi:MAG: DegV family protein [Bacilli bacterium]
MQQQVRIFSDTCSSLTVAEGAVQGIVVSPLNIELNGASYLDTVELDASDFYTTLLDERVPIPTTSQPTIGDITKAYDAVPSTCKILNITPAAGLSGTHNGAILAGTMSQDPNRIHVFDSHTICAAQRYLVEKAQQLALEGKNLDEILQELEISSKDTESFMIPVDMRYLQRGGRLTRAASIILGMLRIKPILTLGEGGNHVDRFGLPARTMKDALKTVMKHLTKMGVGLKHKIYICHANALDGARLALDLIKEYFPGVEAQTLILPPVLGAHAGPGTVVVQYIRK